MEENHSYMIIRENQSCTKGLPAGLEDCKRISESQNLKSLGAKLHLSTVKACTKGIILRGGAQGVKNYSKKQTPFMDDPFDKYALKEVHYQDQLHFFSLFLHLSFFSLKFFYVLRGQLS